MICNLSIAEYRGIMAQQNGHEMTCQEMAEIMELSPSRSSRVIDNLVKKGYFIRKTSKHDRRSVAVTLSHRGREIKEEIKKNRQQLEKDLKEYFSESDIDMIKNSLRMLLDYFV
ncbi:MAG: MarR family transcriptional regulator [Atribacterota bacterium]|nr:MarR family transcriptional regulator [Atribacterota bacterium]